MRGQAKAILQRWTAKWGGTYVDIKSEEDIQDGDKLRVTPVPQLGAKPSVSALYSHILL